MLTLLCINWTASFAQTGKDTVACYTQSELLKIANKMVHADECDSLYSISEKQLEARTNQIYAYITAMQAKDKEIAANNSVVILKEKIIAGKDVEMTGLRDINKKANRRLKWTRIGWISTSAVLTYFVLTK